MSFREYYSISNEIKRVTLLLLNNYRIVILDCPYSQFHSETVKTFFTDLIELKIDGYIDEYGFGALPVDTTDFIGTHIALCEEESTHWKPIMAFKTISLSRSQDFGIPFSPLSLLKGKLNDKSFEKVCSLIESRSGEISFDSSWTVSSAYRAEKGAPLFLLEAMAGLMTLYHQDSEVGIPELIVSGTMQVRADAFFIKMGAERIGEDSIFSHPAIKGGMCSILHLKEFSPFALRSAEKYRALWNARVTIDGSKVKAAS